MKKIFPSQFAIFVLVLITSCSSLINKEDCKKDMKEFGFDHGKRGLSNHSEDLRKVCVTSDESINLEAYQMGFNTGWSDFCTSFHGFEMGRKGDIYKSLCPVEKEELFHEKFLIGKNVYDKKDQVAELEEKIKNLKTNSEKDLVSQAIKDELKRNQDDLLSLKREIQALEQKGLSLIHTN
jgi:hypothetical protein